MGASQISNELRTIVFARLGKDARVAAEADETLADLLRRQPVLAVGQAANLHIEYESGNGTGFRVWLSRCGLADGEPFENTVYLEERDEDGRWVDVGTFDGDNIVAELGLDMNPTSPLEYTRHDHEYRAWLANR